MVITSFIEQYLLYYTMILSGSFLLSFLIIPSIIHIAQTRHLYDDLSHARKMHDPAISRLGGVAIFISFSITLLLLGIDHLNLPVNYLLTACILIFAIGIKDDLTGVGPRTKFTIEFLAAFILVVPGNIRLNNLYGLFSFHEISYCSSVALSILILMFMINAFNLIDGIDGLAATTGILTNGTFMVLFIQHQQYELAAVSLAMAGAMLGFLQFNITPAKIFMGDTGALLIGLVSAVMGLKYIALSEVPTTDPFSKPNSAPGIALAVLIGPIADTLRIFMIRLAKGKSPFHGDRNHVHHRLLQLGFSHLQTTAILILLNAVIILLAFLLSGYGNTVMICTIFLTIIGLNCLLSWLLTKKSLFHHYFS